MSEILRKWLADRLGVIVNYELTSFEDIAQDGTLLARILYNYGIITAQNYEEITNTYDLQIIQSNLALLRIWLKVIGIDLTEKEIHGIANREKFVAVRLFYQLYVILNTRSKIDKFNIVEDNRSQSSLKSKQLIPYNACAINEMAVSPFANDIKDLLRWHKNKYLEVIEKCNSVREEYAKKLENKIKAKQDKKSSEPKNYYDALGSVCTCRKRKMIDALKKPDISVEVDSKGHCLENLEKAKEYINYLKNKYYKCSSIKRIQKHLNKMILHEVLDTIVDKEDLEFKEIITSKLLKQSFYEKQMTTKLINIRYQKHNMLENLQRENNKIIKQKEKEFVDKLFQQDANLTITEQQLIDNQKRKYELHKRLWSEKLKKEYKQKFDMCYKIMNSVVDLALKYAEYCKDFGHKPSSNDWKQNSLTFRSGENIFGYIEDPTQILYDENNELTLETYRQKGIDECDFNDYLNHEGNWNIELEKLINNEYQIDCASNILGYIVHKLLLLKYPLPNQISMPVLPPTDVRAAIIGLIPEVVPLLQKILTSQQIIVVEPQILINYFITAYIEESRRDIEEELVKKRKKGKEKKEKKKDKSKKGSKKAKQEIEIEFVPKETQTPNIYPCCEIKLSTAGELGQYCFEVLNLGQQINENKLIHMLAEYLKTFTYLKGFILVNFPETINEAYCLEEFFNGKDIPTLYLPDTQSDLEEEQLDRDNIFELPFDEFSETRSSKLLPNPKPPEEKKYESCLTSITFMFCQNPDDDLPDNIKPLYEFYEKLLIANRLNYEKFNIDVMKNLMEYILKDVILAVKICEELVALAKAESKKKRKNPFVEEKGKKDKKRKDKKKEKKSDKSSKKGKKIKIETEEIKEVVIVDSEVFVEPPKPGEPLWEYVNISIPIELTRILATSWQDIELIYTNDFKELFFMKRLVQNRIMPYIHEIETNIQYFIERPDNKQQHVHNFQELYNEIQTDLREDIEYKAELHFRLQEFRNKLWNICDEKMRECEKERQKFINENWFIDHSVYVLNIYIRAIQLEINRCVDTLQFLQDYYTSLTLQKPLENKFVKQNLELISNDKLNYTGIVSAFLDINKTTVENTFIKYLDNLLQNTTNIINHWKNSTNAPIKYIESQYINKEKDLKPKKVKKKNKSPPLTELDIKISNNIQNIVYEWRTAIEGEILRTIFYLQLIHDNAITNLEESTTQAEYLFHEIYNKIQERYNEEVESVDLICQIFSRAIEACEPIQVRLILQNAKFYIDDKKLFYPDPAFDYGDFKEQIHNYEFTIAQLNLLFAILNDLAPDGVISQKLFSYLLEDMLVINAKDNYLSPLPNYWKYLKPNQVSELIKQMYSNDDYIDWKDFIVWNLLITFPSEYDIINTSVQFKNMDPDNLEYVNKQQFYTVKFWFENDFKDEEGLLRMSLFKELLYKMFLVASDQVNYTGLLLYFCKDEEPLQGVIKALELAVGQLVCWDVSLGERFVVLLRKQKAIDDALKKEALTAATSVVESVYDRACQECISTFSFLDISEEIEENFEEEIPNIYEEFITEEEILDENIPPLCYILEWPILLKVMTASLPKESINLCMNGKSLKEKLKDIYCSLQNEEFDNKVFMHEFLNHEDFVDIINMTSKFISLSPPEIVKNIVEVCTCEIK